MSDRLERLRAQATEQSGSPRWLIVGIDPGLRTCGVALIERQGQRYVRPISMTIASDARTPVAKRIEAITLAVAESIYDYAVTNVLVAIEDQVLVQRGKQERGETQHMSLPVRDVQFAIAGAAWALGWHVVFIQPQTAKMAVCGSARASKKQVERAVTALLGLVGERKEHEYDAMAVAIAAAQGAVVQHLPTLIAAARERTALRTRLANLAEAVREASAVLDAALIAEQEAGTRGK